MKSIITAVTAFAGIFFASAAQADTPIYRAACQYREAVRDFEDAIRDLRYVPSCDRRLVDDFEDSTSDLRNAARRCDRLDRLECAWNETRRLHDRVQYSIVRRYGNVPCVASAWERVACSYRDLAHEVDCVLQRHHGVPPVVPPTPHLYHQFPQSPSAINPALPPAPTTFVPSNGRFGQQPWTYGNSAFPSQDFRNLNRSGIPTRRTLSSSDMRSIMIGAMLSRLSR